MQTFLKNQVESTRPDGYWLEAFPFHVEDNCGLNLVGHGLGTSTEVSKIEMFINPRRDSDRSVIYYHFVLLCTDVFTEDPLWVMKTGPKLSLPNSGSPSPSGSIFPAFSCGFSHELTPCISYADITGNKYNDGAQIISVM